MRIVLEKNGVTTSIVFEYKERSKSAVAKFNNFTYYPSTKNEVSKKEMLATVNRIARTLKKKGFTVSSYPRFYHSKGFHFIRPFAGQGDVNLVKDVLEYYKSKNFFLDMNLMRGMRMRNMREGGRNYTVYR